MGQLFVGEEPQGLELTRYQDGQAIEDLSLQITEHGKELYLQVSSHWPEDIRTYNLSEADAQKLLAGLVQGMNRVNFRTSAALQ